MKKMKKFFAMFLALAMVLGMSVTTFAVEPEEDPSDKAPTFSESTKKITAPSENETGTVTISGKTIKQNEVSFTAYQLIGAKFTGTNFEGYQWKTPYVDDLGSSDYGVDNMIVVTKEAGKDVVAGLTSTNINKWAASASGGTTPEVDWGTDGTGELAVGTAKMDLGVGTWMIIATPVGNVDVVYNPMIVSVYYRHSTTDGTTNDWAVGGNVNADGNWELVSQNAYQKSTDIGGEEEKKVGTLANGEFTVGDANAQVGQNLGYQLSGRIPSYAPEYFATTADGATTNRTVNYVLKDSKNAGLEYVNGITVKVGGTVLEQTTGSRTNYEIKWYTDAPVVVNGSVTDSGFKNETTDVTAANAFTLRFTSEYIQTLAGTADTAREFEVNYSAKITNSAVSAVAENKYKVEFTRTPGGPDEETDEKTVYSYTAAINGTIQKTNGTTALGGAVFTLYEDENLQTPFRAVAATDELPAGAAKSSSTDGGVNFSGLAFDKTYYLKETAAPDGYSINTTVYEITCTYKKADGSVDESLFTDGKLTKYKVTIKNKTTASDTKTFTVNYGDSQVVVEQPFTIVNTTLASLPSTGGIGTTIFTIGGCAIMIIAAGLYFSLRRRTVK